MGDPTRYSDAGDIEQKVREKKILSENAPYYDSWNPDASIATLGPGDVSQALNLRMQRLGEYEKRSGYRDRDQLTLATDFEIVAKCDYRYLFPDNTSVFFDLTFVINDGVLKVRAINRGPIPSTSWVVAYSVGWLQNETTSDLIITDGLDAFERVCALQFGPEIVISVFGKGTWTIYPVAEGTPLWGNPDKWHVRSEGHKRSITPWQIHFADTTDGDLFVVLNDIEVLGGSREIKHYKSKHLDSVPPHYILPPFQFYRLPVGAPYKLSSDSEFSDVDSRYFEFNDADPSTGSGVGAQPARSFAHLETNAWGYIYRIKRKEIDSTGAPVTILSEPSADQWVRNNIYDPPQVLQLNTGETVWHRSGQFFGTDGSGLTPGAGNTNFKFVNYPFVAGIHTYKAVPSASAMQSLGEKIMKYYGQDWVYNVTYGIPLPSFVQDDRMPMLYWVGYRAVLDPANEEIDFDGDYKCPYFHYVDAYSLKRAPLTKFDWTDFSTLDGVTANPAFPSDAFEIEIYRTAYNHNDGEVSVNGVTQPLFQPHLYGYVGTVAKDGSFTDDVEDESIDFSRSPTDNPSYLEGEFSGSVIRDYQNQVVLGNIRTLYSTQKPAGFPQAYFAPVMPLTPKTANSYTTDDVPPALAGDGFKLQFYISYVDLNGTESELVKVKLDSPDFGTTNAYRWFVAFKIPRGPVPFITGVRIYASVKSNTWSLFGAGSGITPRTYFLIKELDPSADHYISLGDEVPISTSTTLPIGSGAKMTNEPGAIIWSNVNDPTTWERLHFRQIRKGDPITFLGVILGQLRVLSERSNDLDNMQTSSPRGEEENKWIGSIGRHTAVAVDQVIYFLSAAGFYYLESQGVVQFPAKVSNTLLAYLNEEITDHPILANARRATLGYNPRRAELWLYMPSSIDLGGVLAARMFIYRQIGGKVVNYEFELTEMGNIDPAVQSVYQPLYFMHHPDLTLYASFKETLKLRTIECDTSKPFTGKTALERWWTGNIPDVMKEYAYMTFTGDYKATLTIRHGCTNDTGIPTPADGMLNLFSTAHDVDIAKQTANARLQHFPQGLEDANNRVEEYRAYTFVTRLETEIGALDPEDYLVRHRSMMLFYDYLHLGRP